MPEISFEHAKKYGIFVDGVEVQRMSNYENEVAILSITEVDQLYLLGVEHDGRQSRIYRALHNPGQGPVPDVWRRWYEASISSKALKNLLVENESLTFAEEANWSVNDVLNVGIGVDMCEFACKMVRNIDGLGYFNDAIVMGAGRDSMTSDATSVPVDERVPSEAGDAREELAPGPGFC